MTASDAIRAIERRRIVDALIPLRDAGKSYNHCQQTLGISAVTLWRIEKAWRKEGEAGLKTKHGNAGRPCAARAEVFSENDVAFVRRLYIQTESLPLALERLSDAGTCSAEARELIDRYRGQSDYPPSFYKLFRVTAEEWAMARGKKHFDGITHTARRGLWVIDEDGSRRQLFSGDLIEADDVSIDCPYYVQLPDGSYSVGRQVLCFRDRVSRKWVGAYAVARERDSYRGEDIARSVRELVDAWGLPGRFRFERGSWESEPISGIKVDDGKGGEMRWGGIASLIPIQHVHSSRGKGTIEGGFRMLHKVLGLHGVRIGKHRGEYEQPTADMLAVNAGAKKPQDCGFIAWANLLTAFERGFTLLNGRPVFCQEIAAKRCPDDVWAEDMQARPGGRLPACSPEMLWHFLPVKREVGAGLAQAGHVKVSVKDYPLPFFFRIGGPGLSYIGDGIPAEGMERTLPCIERGHRLIVAFDPQRAAEGAVIFNAERGPKNTEGWSPMQKLFIAPLSEEAPQVDLSGGAHGSPDMVAKRTRDAQVRAGFTSIGLYGAGARRVRQDHDGAGNVARVESGVAARNVAPAVRTMQAIAARVTTAAQKSGGGRNRTNAEPVRDRRSPDALIEDFTLPVARRATSPAATAPLVEDW
jgi:hypothetical protein